MQIQRSHKLGRNAARLRVEQVATTLADKYNLRTEWHGDDLKFSGSGADGCIRVGDESIEVDAKLSFPLTMLESTIAASVEDALDKHLEG